MRCEEVMKSSVEYLGPEEPVELAAVRMRDCNIGFLPICDASGRVLGAITDRDIAIRLVAEGRPGSLPVRDIMSREVVSCRPEDDLRTAEQIMAKKQKSRMLCVDEQGRLVGVISLSDIAQRDSGAQAWRTLRQVSEREAGVH